MKRLFARLAMIGVAGLCGCISRRSGFAVASGDIHPGMTYREVVEQLGNPAFVRPVADGEEAVWAGMATSGSELSIKYYVPLLKLGRTRARSIGLRMHFDAAGRLLTSTPTGTGEPVWGWLPFGKE